MTEQLFDTKDLATMDANIKHIKEKVDDISEKMDLLNGRVRGTENAATKSETRWEEHKTAHEGLNSNISDLEGDVRKWGAGIGIGTISVASVIAFLTNK